ncbi:MAG: hypothetical protein HY909_15000 [Deltaproteobacteria bacterium]|nr:hypothetical protein [Deltaproteobacteria bacterium]
MDVPYALRRGFFAALLWALPGACDGPSPATDAPAGDSLDGAPTDVPEDAPEVDGGGMDAPEVPSDAPAPSLLLCEARCARQERAACAGFTPDGCPARCVEAFAGVPARCVTERDALQRCEGSFAEYRCDPSGRPVTADCDAEEGALRRCAGAPDAGADAAGDALEDVATKDLPAEPAPDGGAPDGPEDVPGDVPGDLPGDLTEDAPMDAPTDAPVDAPMDASGPDGALDTALVEPAPDAPEDVAPEVEDRPRADRPPSDAPPTLVCPAPTAAFSLPGAAVLRDDETAGANDIPSTRCQPDAEGPEDAYALTVTVRTGLLIDTEGARTDFDTVLSLRALCDDPRAELACDDDGGRDRTSSLRTILDPGRYALLVDGFGGGSGRYALRVSSFTPAPNSGCAGALALAPGARLAAQDARNGGFRGAACRASGGGPLFYTVAVPAGSRVRVTATPLGPFAPVLAAADNCTRACTTESVGEREGAPSSLVLTNTGGSARTFVVSVASAGNAAGLLDLEATPAAPLARGSTCEGALALTAGAALGGQDVTLGLRSGEALCAREARGGQAFYALRIPPRQRAAVRVTPSAGLVVTARLLRSCAATACAAEATALPGSPVTLVYDNADTFALDVLVTVAAASATDRGTFEVLATLSAIPPGALCEAPIALTPTAPVRGNTTAGFRSGERACAPSSTGPQLFHAVRIPAGQRATVRATALAPPAWRPTLRAFTSCTATTCLQNATADGVGAPVSLALDNRGAAPQDVLVSLAGALVPSGGPYELTVAFGPSEPPPYVVTTIPMACDTLPASAAVAPVDGWDDDDATDTAALPFPFRLAGTVMSHYAVVSNGYLQLFPDGSPEADVRSGNLPIPNASPPNGFVAPFWDDLLAVDEETTFVYAALVGAAPSRRFVVEWRDWAVLGDLSIRLHFQAKLFEGGAVEFHYCSMTPTRDVVLGGSATVGLEDLAGGRGVELGYNRMGVVDPAMAFRLVPR